MNILILNSIGKKKWGGGESWMVLIAKELQQKGHSVIIGCRRKSIIQANAEVAHIPVIPFDIYTDFSLIGIIQLIRVLRVNEIDVVIACQNKDVRIAGFARAITCSQKPLIVARQGIQRIHNSWKYRITFTKLCDSIVTNTASLKSLYDSYGWWNQQRVHVIHNGVELADNHEQTLDITQWISRVDNIQPIVVATTCRLAKQKNLELLIDAAATIIEQDNRYYFLIAGEGKQRNVLQQKIDRFGIGHRVKLIGFIPQVSHLLKASDIFVLPSAYEGMSNSIIEAMLAGLPVVCSNVNGAVELITTNENGLLFDPNDTHTLVSHLLALSNPQLRHKLGTKARQTIVTQFSSTQMAENYENYLTNLLAEFKRRS